MYIKNSLIIYGLHKLSILKYVHDDLVRCTNSAIPAGLLYF